MVAGRLDRRLGFHRYRNSCCRPSPSSPAAVPSLDGWLVSRSSSSTAAVGLGSSGWIRPLWRIRPVWMGSRIRWRPSADGATCTGSTRQIKVRQARINCARDNYEDETRTAAGPGLSLVSRRARTAAVQLRTRGPLQLSAKFGAAIARPFGRAHLHSRPRCLDPNLMGPRAAC
jgi:hypothetical protein